MLFTDGTFITQTLLDTVDGEFSSVAQAEGINTSSFIAEKVLDAANEFTANIQSFSGYLVGVGVNANHQAAVLNVLSTAINRPRALLNQIPVIEPNPTRTAMRRWVQWYVLYEFYLAMSFRKVKDRYKPKADNYEKQKLRAWENLEGNGFPLVVTPLPCPGAALEYNPGSWSAANVTAVSGGSTPEPASYDVVITWCNLPTWISSSNQNNGESAGSAMVTQLVEADQVLEISIASLNPPNGILAQNVGVAQGIYSPLAATHWNVYAGPTGGTLYLQNNAPIPIATTSYTFTAAPSTSGFPLSAGQAANYDFSFQHVLWRA